MSPVKACVSYTCSKYHDCSDIFKDRWGGRDSEAWRLASALHDVWRRHGAQVMQTFNKATGEKEAISFRCADMDRQVPHVMGVSKVCPPSGFKGESQ